MKKLLLYLLLLFSLISFSAKINYDKTLSKHSTNTDTNNSVLSASSNITCQNATALEVNPDLKCKTPTKGKFSRTALLPDNTIVPSPNHPKRQQAITELWYEFTATNTNHFITVNILDIDEYSFPTWKYYLAVYKDDNCLNNADSVVFFDEVERYPSSLTNLIVGQKYKIRIFRTAYYWNPFPNSGHIPYQLHEFEICILTPPNYIKTSATRFTKEELVTKVLVKNTCGNFISNIKTKTGTDYPRNTGINYPDPIGIGYFEKNGSSFAFDEGIILSSGIITQAPGPKKGLGQNAGEDTWLGDTDLYDILKPSLDETITKTMNASVVEFDFVALGSKLSFNFIFASEEYGFFQCQLGDGFAFILTDLETNTKKNLAVVPNTTSPVSVMTIRDKKYNSRPEVSCESVNANFFSNYAPGGVDFVSISHPLNFKGYTKSLTASSELVPGKKYHIKLVVADANDTRVDSAIFIEAGSFDVGELDLGANKLIENNTALCSEESFEIDSHLSPQSFTFKWFKDGTVINEATSSKLSVTEPGDYSLEAQIKNTTCFYKDNIIIEKYPEIRLKELPAIELCTFDDVPAEINLTENEAKFFENPADKSKYNFFYFNSMSDAVNGSNNIQNPEQYTADRLPKTIYLKIIDKETSCFKTTAIKLLKSTEKEVSAPKDVISCTIYILPELPENYYYSTQKYGKGKLLNLGKNILKERINYISTQKTIKAVFPAQC